MEYISAKETAKLWSVDISRIGKFARDGRIEGAKIVGRNWLIPKDAVKPIDGRRKKAKDINSSFFRFPIYVNFSEESLALNLSQEEKTLCQAQVDFYNCEFEKAKVNFKTLSENAQSIYVKICANFFMCVLSASYDTNINWKHYYSNINFLLSKDFPHKKEMELFLPYFDFYIGKFAEIPKKLSSDYQYEYHKSALYTYAFLSVYNLPLQCIETAISQCLSPYESLCRIMERDEYYLEAQALHYILFTAYFSIHNTDLIKYHIKKFINIAYEHNLLYIIADAEHYYSEEIDAVLSDYPTSFVDKIKEASKIIYESFAYFTDKNDVTKIYSKLSKNDYRFLVYAMKNLSNKQIAKMCCISERTVANRYNDIYNKLGVSNKHELLKEINIAIKTYSK